MKTPRDIDLAMQELEVLGVPRDYAKTPAKGIRILADRFAKDKHFDSIALADLQSKLQTGRDAIYGWREADWPEWFDRRTAEAMADRLREALSDE